MKLLVIPFLATLLLTFKLSAQEVTATERERNDSAGKSFQPYTQGPKTRDGIGKYYMGREISYVMGHLAAGWLERSEREREEKPSKLIENLKVAPDAVLADIGAGSGYFTFRLAQKVPKGKVYAVDIQPEMITILKAKMKAEGHENVKTVLSEEADTKLPPGVVDGVLLVDVYHEFAFPREMLTSIYQALKPGGQVYLLEYRAEDPSVPIKPLHKMSQKQAKREFEASGFYWVETLDFLPRQHFIRFEKPKPETKAQEDPKPSVPNLER